MRIALAIEFLNPAGGGAERNCVELSRHLARRGHGVTILCGDAIPGSELAAPQVDVETGPGRPHNALRLVQFSNWVDRRLNEGGFDASLCFHTTAAADVLMPLGGTVRQTQARNVAMRSTGAERWFKFAAQMVAPKQVALRKLEQRTLAHGRVKAIAAISGYVRRQFEDAGVPPEKIRLIPNAVDLTPPTEAQRRQWRTKVRRAFDIDAETTVFLFAAYNPRLKGVGPLLAALQQVAESGVDAVLLLAGGVGYHQQRSAAKMGVRPRVRFVGQTQQMPALFAAADVTVHPTFHDPASRIVIESLVSGTPAITTRYNGAADFVEHHGRLAGRVIEQPGDVAQLAAAMTELADPKVRRRCRAAAKDVGETLSIEAHVDQVEALLREVADNTAW